MGKNSELKKAVSGMSEAIEDCKNTVSIDQLEKDAGTCADCAESSNCTSATDEPNKGIMEEQVDASWETDGEACYAEDDDEISATEMPSFGDCLKIIAGITAAAGLVAIVAFGIIRKVTKDRD